VWLHRVIQECAGLPLDQPLTFAHLWAGRERPLDPDDEQDAKRLRELGWNEQERVLDLQMMTTNLTHGRPMRVPVGRDRYPDDAEDGGGLLFDPDEWSRFFPASAIEHMRVRARPLD